MVSVVKNMYKNDPAAGGLQFLLYPGFWAVFVHRYLSHPLYSIGLKFCGLFFCQIARFVTQVEIHPGAKIGKGLFIDHGNGVVIGETAEIGDNCMIYHGVTLGGTGNHSNKRHPSVGNNVFIGSGATLLGPIQIGDNVKIGAKSLIVMRDVPSNSTVIGAPARIVKLEGKTVNMDLNRTKTNDKKVSMEVWKNCEVKYKNKCG
ncbi:serine O-acetyltransferase EpsC [uncultured Draconibacterium sp.]|uniref:serine O-acetyltransferase EpsC n=1 Tax=uncultured Draconibacterium sp. TaxID=1573823 RepID=UPI003217698F